MTTPPPTLHDRLRAELDRRLAVANSATSGPWTNADPMARDGVFAPAIDGFVVDCDYVHMGPFAVHNATFIALHDPADANRRYVADLETLDYHRLCDPAICRSLRRLGEVYPEVAGRLGVSVDG